MSLLIRKIQLSKWMQNDIKRGAPPSADAITHCTKTQYNTLSVWSINADHDLTDAVLAIATGAHHLETFDVVKLNRNSLEQGGLSIENVPGETAYHDFIQKHYDIQKLDIRSLTLLSEEIVRAIRDEQCIRYTKGALKKLLRAGIDEGKISCDDLAPDVKKIFVES